MDSLARACLLLCISMCVCGITGVPFDTTINCAMGGTQEVGPVDEGYEGDVEVAHGITAGSSVTLIPYLFPDHLEFLELNFSLGETSATVHTRKMLDADVVAGSTLYYAIECGDSFRLKNNRMLRINDLNDNSPVFVKKFYNISVSETEKIESMVLVVEAVDGDSTSANNRVSYRVLQMDPPSEDFIVTISGAVTLKKRLNYNIVQRYNFTVLAYDSGGLNDTATVLINVVDFDNLNPYFDHNLYQASIPENEAGPVRSIQPEAIKAQDGDSGINVTVLYSISAVSPNDYASKFNIDQFSGVLSVVTPIDREELASAVITINIEAAQSDDSLKTAGAVVSVTVEDVNDNPPKFDSSDYSVTLLENSPVTTVLLRVIVTDLDQGGFKGNLSILQDVPFSISADGTIRVKDSAALDRETTGNFMFQIKAKEDHSPHHEALATVNVTLLDENDNSPEFTSSEYLGKVFADDTVGKSLVQVEAHDPDLGLNGQITYSIDFGNNEGYFSINNTTGEITLANLIPMEENRILEFFLYVTARDGGVVSRFSSVQVKIVAPGDTKPQFLQKTYMGTITEEQDPDVFILKVKFLALTAATLQVESEADKFALSPSGDFTSKVKLDYDEGPHNYSVEISISDGTTTDTAVVKVHVTDINDNSPVFVPDSITKVVPEDAAVGSSVTDVRATDKDSGFNGQIRYFLRGGEGKFSIDIVSGMVNVTGALDRETKAEYSLTVVAEDHGRPARTDTVTLLVPLLDVNDNNPVFSKAEYEVEVLETETVGTSLLTLSAVDEDEGANGRVTYSILQQNPPSDPAVFTLDSSTGTLQLAQPLDYSLVKEYRLVVQAVDGGTPALVGNGSVVLRVKDVNNNPPEFSKTSYDVAVSENLASGASILTMEVTDRDEGGFSNGYFIYSNDTFDISKQGVVSLRTDVTLDRETKDRYVLQVVAVDQVTDGLSATAQLNITVLDYNDNAPQFPVLPDPLPIPEGDYSEETPGEIFTIVPTDADLGLNGEVTLSFPSPNPLFTFREDGTLLAVGVLDRETRDTFQLLIKASDKGQPQRENVTVVTVSVTDVNDNRPEFSSSSYVSSFLLKDAEEGKLLLTLHATDRDDGSNALISYSFLAGGSPYVALNSETGEVTLTSDFADVTEDTSLDLTAMAEDHGRPPLNSTVSVVINMRIASLMEGVAFLSSSYNFSLPENQPGGGTVGRVKATSGSDLYDVAYLLKTHTDLFSIDASGAITAKKALDKESQEWYILEVEAVDTRTPPTSAVAMVRVQVEDVNEAPRFLSETYKATIFAIAPYKSSVVQVKATDPDVGDEGQLVYSASSPYFDVDASSGLVYVVSAEGLGGQVIPVEVKATDPDGLAATAKVEVTVEGSASSVDVVTIILNQPTNVVEKKVSDMEDSLGKVLGWTVRIIEVSNAQAPESRSTGGGAKTLVSFIAADGGEVVSSVEVTKKLQSESAKVKTALEEVFGAGLQFEVEEKPKSPASNQAAVIALAVLLALSILGLLVMVFVTIRLSRKKKPLDQDKESFDISRNNEGYTNWSKKNSETSEKGRRTSQEDNQLRKDSVKQSVKWDSSPSETVKRDSNDGTLKDRETVKDSETEDRQSDMDTGRDNDLNESYSSF